MKYKKCCLAQDEKSAAEKQAQKRRAENERLAELVKYAEELETQSNLANDLILAKQWDEAEACCRRLRERFPDEIDGAHRSYEYCKARGDCAAAKTHAQAALAMIEQSDGFDPELEAILKEDIALFDEQLPHPPT